MLGSKHTFSETIKKIEAAAIDVSLSVQRLNNFKVGLLPILCLIFRFPLCLNYRMTFFWGVLCQIKMHPKQKMTRRCRSYFDLSAEVMICHKLLCNIRMIICL